MKNKLTMLNITQEKPTTQTRHLLLRVNCSAVTIFKMEIKIAIFFENGIWINIAIQHNQTHKLIHGPLLADSYQTDTRPC